MGGLTQQDKVDKPGAASVPLFVFAIDQKVIVKVEITKRWLQPQPQPYSYRLMDSSYKHGSIEVTTLILDYS